MPAKTFYCYCPCFPGFAGESALALNSYDQKTSYLTHLCETWDLPYEVILEYFTNLNDLTYDDIGYLKEACPMYVELVGDEIYRESNYELDVELSFVREEYVTILKARRKHEEHKLLMRAIFDPDELIAYLRPNLENFAFFLKLRKIKSDPEKWLDPANWDEPRILEIILEYVLRDANKDIDERLYNRLVYEVDPEEYITTPDDFTHFLQDNEENDLYWLGSEYRRLMKQGNDYLEAMKRDHPKDWEKYTVPVLTGKNRVARELAEDLDKAVKKFAEERA